MDGKREGLRGAGGEVCDRGRDRGVGGVISGSTAMERSVVVGCGVAAMRRCGAGVVGGRSGGWDKNHARSASLP